MASLKQLTVADLRRELERREKGGHKLAARHSKLASRLAEIDAELAELGVAAPARRGRKPGRMPGRPKGSGRTPRAKNSMSLLQAIMSGLRAGSTVSPAEAAAAAKKAGYSSSSPNFGMMVANALAKAGEFKRTGRGQYLFKGAGKSAKPAKASKPAKPARSAKKAKRKIVRRAKVAKVAKATPAAPVKTAKSKPAMAPTAVTAAAAAG
jgi:hypothetical protein